MTSDGGMLVCGVGVHDNARFLAVRILAVEERGVGWRWVVGGWGGVVWVVCDGGVGGGGGAPSAHAPR